MGFYGKIANSNKTAFSFDRTYTHRIDMDDSAQTDGVFIGRYVLIEYDEPPITGYYDKTDFYSAASFQPQTKITPRQNVVYQDLLRANSAYSFYIWDGTKYTGITEQTGYAWYYTQDVRRYGRGYDSTAWMKTYDTTTNKYRYVLVAELNTIVPSFHLIYDAPSNKPTAPYFDRDTTNVDYFLHAQAEWGHGVRLFGKSSDYDGTALPNVINNIDGVASDERIQYVNVTWNSDVNDNQYYDRTTTNEGNADIYYNKAGFNRATHVKAPSSIINTINYSYDKSGRKYGGGLNNDGTAFNAGSTQIDMMEWYIHLPVIGNAICEIWDVLYGYDSENKRYTKLATKRSDDDGLVTYNIDYAYGALNKIRDILGWVIQPKGDDQNVNSYTSDIVTANTLYYTLRSVDVNKEEPVIDKYYYYAYDPVYSPLQKDGSSNRYYYTTAGGQREYVDLNNTYYLDPIDNSYRHPNLRDWPATMSDGTVVGETYNSLYRRQNSWKLVELDTPIEDSIYGLIIKLHRLLGDYSPEVRDENSIIGCINLMKDTIANVDRHLAPNRLLLTNSLGQITTNSDFNNNEGLQGPEYPYFNTMQRTIDGSVIKYQEILNSHGEWHLPVWYRLYTLSLKNSQNNARYFDAGYYGNSARHELTELDTIGKAFLKISEDLADAHYIKPEVLSFTALAAEGGESYNGGIKIENGRSLDSITLNYELNKGERQTLTIDRLVPQHDEVYTHSVPYNYHLDAGYESSKTGEQIDNNVIAWNNNMHDSAITWRITVVDERSAQATKEVSLYYMDKVYWGVGDLLSDTTGLSNHNGLVSLLGTVYSSLQTDVKSKFTVTASTDKYIYFACPTAMVPRFEICGIEGGFIRLGSQDFRNQSNYTTNYTFYRTVRPALGKSEVVVKEG